ncbi:MAG: hypothetical protein J6K05_06715 [Bacteroidaceae bacterium]|nr:hypothetical protein [Bacteroidaceae bacterium]
MADDYIYDDKTGEFTKKTNSTHSNSNNDDDGCLGGCIGGLFYLIVEYWWIVLGIILGICFN